MALINCPECGKEISNSTTQCIHCGYILKKTTPPQHNKGRTLSAGQKKKIPSNSKGRPKNKSSRRLIIIAFIAVFIIAISVSVALLVNNYIIPEKNYKVAEETLESEDFDGAAAQFTKLGDYKDSAQRVLECYYKKGFFLISENNYTAAIKAFEQAGDYQDAIRQVEKAEAKIAEEQAVAAHQAVIEKLRDASKKCTSSGTSLSSDGLSLMIDSKDKYDKNGLQDVYTVTKELGLPDSLIEDMEHTSALMGKQTQTCGDYEVSWSYHPDNGLDVLIKVIDK